MVHCAISVGIETNIAILSKEELVQFSARYLGTRKHRKELLAYKNIRPLC
jgi:hypothetical protein